MGSPCWGMPQQGLMAPTQSEFPDLRVQYRLRAIVDAEGERLLCLFDDPVKDERGLPDNPAQATAIAASEVTDADIPQIKTLLTLAFGPLRRLAG
jgi:hypothetical protein